MRRKLEMIALLLFFCGNGWAQKSVLDTTAYKRWRRVDTRNISDDGKWVTYRLVYIDEHDGKCPETYLYGADGGKTDSLGNVENPTFFNRGKWLRYTCAGDGKDSTFLLRLRDRKRIYWDREYDFSESANSAYVTYAYPLDKERPAFKRLVIWNIETGDTIVRDSVENYMFTRDEPSMVYVKNQGGRKSFCYQSLKGKPVVIFDDPDAWFKSYSLLKNEAGGTLVAASDSSRLKNPNLLYSFSIADGRCDLLVDLDRVRLPAEYAWRGRPYRLSNGKTRVILDVDTVNGLTGKKKGEKDSRFELELWTWNDEVSSLQQRTGNYEPSNIKFVYDLKKESCYRIASQNLERLIFPSCDTYDYAFGIDSSPYKRFSDWKNDINCDIYIIDMNNGKTTLFERNASQTPEWSPDGKCALWYDAVDRAWYKIDPATGGRANVSKEIGYPVHDELHDLPKPADAYGIAGWAGDGGRVFVYDRYDLWAIDLSGKQATYSLTRGFGRNTGRRLRWLKNDYDDKIMDIRAGFLIHSVNLDNKDEGIFEFKPDGKLKPLMEGAYSLALDERARNQKYCLFTRQSYAESRDLWWSDLGFTRPVRLTEANPQQNEYAWGRVELVKWTNYAGKENAGLLYLPDGYDPDKRYPVIVNFYETHTEGLHAYVVPALSSAMINVVSYVSDGYVVFMPDVHFTVGNPGQSSYDAVVSGTRMLIDRGIADKDRVGIQGHSWSGYQVAYLVTRTNLFACASPGAAVSNMVSAYTGIRQGSGMPRMFMYEETQSRLGKSLWEDKEMYLRHSPILEADKIETPLLIFHCDADEAVPYAEGLNLFLAMRRLQKPAWLLNYKGEQHFLHNRAAETDWTMRQRQFFDHYLKGKPLPRWMKEGIQAHERGFDQKYDY